MEHWNRMNWDTDSNWILGHEDDIAAYAKRHLVMKDGKLVKDEGNVR